MGLTAKITAGVSAKLDNTIDFGSAAATVTRAYELALTNGTGAGQADRLWSDQRTLTASATEDLDLAGVLTDALGTTLSLARIKGLIVAAAAANTNTVVLGGAGSNGFTSWVGGAAHTVTIRPGATFALFCGSGDATGYAVTAATGDILKVANGGASTSVTYDIVVIGCSA